MNCELQLATRIVRCHSRYAMKGDRLRIPVEPAYVSALGLAIFAFARLEWAAVCCCERIEPNSIHALPKNKKMAGGIAKKLMQLAARLPASSEQIELRAAAAEFERLVQTRNDLLHVQPGSITDGAQRIFRDGLPWEIEKINEAADDFTYVDDPLLARCLQCFDQIACVHMSGLSVRSHMNAGQDGFRDKSSKQKGDLIEGHWKMRSFSRRGSIDHTICSLSCKFWFSSARLQLHCSLCLADL